MEPRTQMQLHGMTAPSQLLCVEPARRQLGAARVEPSRYGARTYADRTYSMQLGAVTAAGVLLEGSGSTPPDVSPSAVVGSRSHRQVKLVVGLRRPRLLAAFISLHFREG